jgi:hypothetical protein
MEREMAEEEVQEEIEEDAPPRERTPARPPAHAATNTNKERKFPCHKCGADFIFAPAENSLICPYCGHVDKIPQTPEEIKEYRFSDYLARPRSKGYGAVPGGRRKAKCGGCGAASDVDASVRATTCAFCGAPLVLDDNATPDEDVITPEAVVPFSVNAAVAEALFRKWLTSLWFAPNALKHSAEAKKPQGVYRPFWTYDSHTVSHWTGERGDAYYVRRGKRRVRKIRWTWVSGTYVNFFDDVLINAGKNKDRSTEYQLSGLKTYTPDYLSGFAAERYAISCQDGWREAKEVIKNEIYEAVENEIGGDRQRVHSIDTAYRGITYKHILLPLWLSCYRFGEKTFCFQVNGQTGEVHGERPWSFWKIFFLVLVIIAAIVGFVILQHKN